MLASTGLVACGSSGAVFGDGSTLPGANQRGSIDAAVGGETEGGASGSTQACTGIGALAPGDTTVTLSHDGVDRMYIVHVPASYAGRTRVPLVVDLHGLASNAAQQEALSGWREKADAVGFIVIYPDGINASWNGGSLCCGHSLASNVDDEGFVRAAVAKVEQDACIDTKRVYATGLSNGGAMAHLLACRAADVFAASAPVSMGNGTMPCQPSRPISVVMFRGTSDPLVPYDGGFLPSAQADFTQWRGLDSCTGQPAATHGICNTSSTCQVETRLR